MLLPTGVARPASLNSDVANAGAAITAAQSLSSFCGSSLTGTANGAALQATILASNMGVALDSLTIGGRLFGRGSGLTFQCFCDAHINQPELSAAPLPPALPFFAAGLSAMAFIG